MSVAIPETFDSAFLTIDSEVGRTVADFKNRDSDWRRCDSHWRQCDSEFQIVDSDF